MQFHPIAYTVKLKIEMSMAELITTIASDRSTTNALTDTVSLPCDHRGFHWPFVRATEVAPIPRQRTLISDEHEMLSKGVPLTSISIFGEEEEESYETLPLVVTVQNEVSVQRSRVRYGQDVNLMDILTEGSVCPQMPDPVATAQRKELGNWTEVEAGTWRLSESRTSARSIALPSEGPDASTYVKGAIDDEAWADGDNDVDAVAAKQTQKPTMSIALLFQEPGESGGTVDAELPSLSLSGIFSSSQSGS